MRERLAGALATLLTSSSSVRDRYLQQAHLTAERDRIFAQVRQAMPENPILAGHKVYSQCDEDGILEEIFSRIGVTNRTCIEFGCGDGSENNTHALLLEGWRALWVEGNPKNTAKIRKALPSGGRDAGLLLHESFVTLANVEPICRAGVNAFDLGEDPVDLLSMDLDGNDLHFLEVLVSHRPRVIVAEYNALLGPRIVAGVAYDEAHEWRGDDYMGCSLASLVSLLAPHGYRLVCCNLSGANAFFVHTSCGGEFGDYSAAQLFQPARYHMIFLGNYTPRTLGFLANTVAFHDLDISS